MDKLLITCIGLVGYAINCMRQKKQAEDIVSAKQANIDNLNLELADEKQAREEADRKTEEIENALEGVKTSCYDHQFQECAKGSESGNFEFEYKRLLQLNEELSEELAAHTMELEDLKENHHSIESIKRWRSAINHILDTLSLTPLASKELGRIVEDITIEIENNGKDRPIFLSDYAGDGHETLALGRLGSLINIASNEQRKRTEVDADGEETESNDGDEIASTDDAVARPEMPQIKRDKTEMYHPRLGERQKNRKGGRKAKGKHVRIKLSGKPLEAARRLLPFRETSGNESVNELKENGQGEEDSDYIDWSSHSISSK